MSNNIVHTLYTRIIGNRWGEAVVSWPRGRLAACRVYYIVFGYFGSRRVSPEARPACLTTHKVLTRWLVHGNSLATVDSKRNAKWRRKLGCGWTLRCAWAVSAVPAAAVTCNSWSGVQWRMRKVDTPKIDKTESERKQSILVDKWTCMLVTFVHLHITKWSRSVLLLHGLHNSANFIGTITITP